MDNYLIKLIKTYLRKKSSSIPVNFLDGLIDGNHLPVEIALEVTNRCNVSCIICDGAQRIKSTGNKPPATWINAENLNNVLEGNEKGRIRSVILSGGYGEPLLNRGIVKIISLLKEKKANVEIISNGTLLRRTLSKKLIHAKLDRLFVSIHGAKKETAEGIMQKSNFKKIISSLSELHKLKTEFSTVLPVVEIFFVAMRRNIHELHDMVVLAKEIGIGTVHIQSLNERQHEGLAELQGESLVWHPELLQKEYEKAKSAASTYGIRLSINAPYSSIVGVNKISTNCNEGKQYQKVVKGKTRYCIFPFAKPSLSIRSTVGLCCSSQGRYIIMGDASIDGFFSIWNGEKYTKIRYALLTGENLPSYCYKCERAPLVNPFVMQMDIALRQLILSPNGSAFNFVNRNRDRYLEYVDAMKQIGVRAHPYPDMRRKIKRFVKQPFYKKMKIISNLITGEQ
ncbi:MAG: radical SAM protein [Desulfobacteraceae bacterium]|nr:radical SAM protein [Desulfobacteraceae bacterium]